MTAIPITEFQKLHPDMPEVDASQILSAALLERAALCNRRLVLTLNGKALAAIVSLADLDLLEATSHGIAL